MRRFFRIVGIGCGGLITLVVVLAIAGALIGGQNNKSQSTDSSKQADTSTQSESSSASSRSSKEPSPINLSGNAQAATDPFNLESGLAIFRLTHQGGGHFSATLLDQNGQRAGMDSLLANEVGLFDGSKALQAKAGQHVLDVSASGPWTITIEQPRPSSAPQTTSFQGNSQTATDFFQLSEGLKKFAMTHQGGGHFSGTLLNKDGSRAGTDSLLANDVGPFDGSKAIRIPKNDTYLLQVDADGPWTVQIT